MIQNVLRTYIGIDTYGIVSLCLFCFIFLSVLVWAFALKRPHLDRMARLPLDNDPNDLPQSRNSHE
jgi:cbb3-type cytochrome oxidase subunit 3